MSDNFIGRKKELEELEFRYKSSRKEFGIIYGRRRIGKSALICRFLEDKPCLLFQAKRDNSYGNLRSFSYELNKLLGHPGNYVYSSWEEAFDALTDFAGENRFILAIDEYPYIVEQCAEFPSILQQLIDNAKQSMFILISGSDVSMLRKEIMDHASPLYKRRTFEMYIKRLPYSEALEFLKDVAEDERLEYLSLLSTYPYYLSSIDTGVSFEDNLQRMLFSQYGIFFNLPDQVLSNSTKVQDVYNAILCAIANRRRSNKEISDYIHEDESKVAKYLVTLLDAEIVTRCETFMGNKKTNYYIIEDPLLRFWYYFIFSNQERIRINGRMVFESLKESIEQFISFGFEDVCRLYLNQLNREGRLPQVFPRIKSYHVEKSKLGRSIEIDGLTREGDSLLVMECKYRKAPFSLKMLEHLVESASVFPEKLNREYYIFSKSGFTDDIYGLDNPNVHLIDAGELLHPQMNP